MRLAGLVLREVGVAIAAEWDARKDEFVVDTFGGKSLQGVLATRAGRRERVELDALLVSGGFSPRIHLACQRGAKPRWSAEHAAFLAPEGTLPLAGGANGTRTHPASRIQSRMRPAISRDIISESRSSASSRLIAR